MVVWPTILYLLGGIIWIALAAYSVLVVATKALISSTPWVTPVSLIILFLAIALSENLQQAANSVAKADNETLKRESSDIEGQPLIFIKKNFNHLQYARQFFTILMVFGFKRVLDAQPNPFLDQTTFLYSISAHLHHWIVTALSSNFFVNTLASVSVIAWFGQLLPKKIGMDYPFISLHPVNLFLAKWLIPLGKIGIGAPADIIFYPLSLLTNSQKVRPGAGTVFQETSNYFNHYVKRREIEIKICFDKNETEVREVSINKYRAPINNISHSVKIFGSNLKVGTGVHLKGHAIWFRGRSWILKKKFERFDFSDRVIERSMKWYRTQTEGIESEYFKKTLAFLYPWPKDPIRSKPMLLEKVEFETSYIADNKLLLNGEGILEFHLDIEVPTEEVVLIIGADSGLSVGKISAQKLESLSAEHVASIEIDLRDVVTSEQNSTPSCQEKISLNYPPYGLRYVIRVSRLSV